MLSLLACFSLPLTFELFGKHLFLSAVLKGGIGWVAMVTSLLLRRLPLSSVAKFVAPTVQYIYFNL